MTMGWNDRDYRVDVNSRNGGGSFEEHNECMTEFRKAHADVALVNGPRLDEFALIESMESLQVSRNMIETGGSALPDDTTDRSPLVPLWKTARYKLSQN